MAIKKELEKANEQGELFDSLRLKALKLLDYVIDLPNDLEHFGGDQLALHRRIQLQASVALSHVNNAIKVDDTRFRAQQHEDWLTAFNQKLADAEAKLLEKQKK